MITVLEWKRTLDHSYVTVDIVVYTEMKLLASQWSCTC